MIIRLKDRENLIKAHRRHLYQLLANEYGIPHWKVSIGYGLLQLVVGISVLLHKPMGLLVISLLLVAYFAGFSLLSFVVRRKLVS
jgi:Fuc2NAc and GlcNAc transferase